MESFELKFEQSCKTIAVRQQDTFLSVFPGKLAFGHPYTYGYKKFQYFCFRVFELFEFYLALVKIINYFASSENNSEKGLILKTEDEQGYFWICKSVLIGNIESKIVVLGIEYQSNIVYELILNGEQLNCLIDAINQSILSCLCLKPIEKELFNCASDQSSAEIINLTNKLDCKKFINRFKANKEIEIDAISFENIVDIIIYYHEVILLLHKFKSVFNNEILTGNNRIEAILKA